MNAATSAEAAVYSIIDHPAVIACSDLEDVARRVVAALAGRKLQLLDSLLDMGDGRGPVTASISVLFKPKDTDPDGQAGSWIVITGRGEQSASLKPAIEAEIMRRRMRRVA